MEQDDFDEKKRRYTQIWGDDDNDVDDAYDRLYRKEVDGLRDKDLDVGIVEDMELYIKSRLEEDGNKDEQYEKINNKLFIKKYYEIDGTLFQAAKNAATTEDKLKHVNNIKSITITKEGDIRTQLNYGTDSGGAKHYIRTDLKNFDIAKVAATTTKTTG